MEKMLRIVLFSKSNVPFLLLIDELWCRIAAILKYFMAVSFNNAIVFVSSILTLFVSFMELFFDSPMVAETLQKIPKSYSKEKLFIRIAQATDIQIERMHSGTIRLLKHVQIFMFFVCPKPEKLARKLVRIKAVE